MGIEQLSLRRNTVRRLRAKFWRKNTLTVSLPLFKCNNASVFRDNRAIRNLCELLLLDFTPEQLKWRVRRTVVKPGRLPAEWRTLICLQNPSFQLLQPPFPLGRRIRPCLGTSLQDCLLDGRVQHRLVLFCLFQLTANFLLHLAPIKFKQILHFGLLFRAKDYTQVRCGDSLTLFEKLAVELHKG